MRETLAALWRRIRGTKSAWRFRYRVAAGTVLLPVFILGLVMAQFSLWAVFGRQK